MLMCLCEFSPFFRSFGVVLIGYRLVVYGRKPLELESLAT